MFTVRDIQQVERKAAAQNRKLPAAVRRAMRGAMEAAMGDLNQLVGAQLTARRRGGRHVVLSTIRFCEPVGM